MMEPNSFDPEIIKQLHKRGYITNEKDSPVIGKVDAIRILPDKRLEGGADHRGDDTAVGF